MDVRCLYIVDNERLYMISGNEERTGRMDRLPCELLHYIIWYMDPPLDLLRMSWVCSRWRTFIMNDEYFLNKWFSRSLKRSRESYYCTSSSWEGDCKPPWKLNFDRSLFPSNFLPCVFDYLPWLLKIDPILFPVNLQSSKCDFLPWITSRQSSDYESVYDHDFDSLLCDSAHSFSFWLFLLPDCELNIQVGNNNVTGVNILLSSNEIYHLDNGESLSIVDRWIHIVLTKTDSKSNYRLWIDGQYVTNISQCQISLDEWAQHSSLFNIVLYRKCVNNPLEMSSQVRIADLNAFKRCLTFVEIRAIHQQQTSIDQIKVGTYMSTAIK
jgi:hypothetical protein